VPADVHAHLQLAKQLQPRLLVLAGLASAPAC
jgi:hypothetical protein